MRGLYRVDKAEEEPDRCYGANVEATRNVAEACERLDVKMIYISTDYVFPGEGEEPFEPDRR